MEHPYHAWPHEVFLCLFSPMTQRSDSSMTTGLCCDAGVSPIELCNALTEGQEAHVREAALLRVQRLQNFLKSFQGIFTLSWDLQCGSLLVTAWDEDTVMLD